MKRTFTRRRFAETSALALATAAAGMSAASWLCRAEGEAPESASPFSGIAPGPFKGNRESLAAYRMPDWFADAKLGMWNHWGPQSAAENGDWYARRMYIQGEPQYQHHLEHYGHPSKTGFAGVINSWKADKFDADYLMGLYKKAGAKYYVAMGCHHDNFDMWNSKFQPRWNAVASGPKRDILGAFARAARRHEMRFGVSEHLSNSFCWFGTAHGSDQSGALAGVPYDGTDPQYRDLYHDYSEMPADNRQ